jgi:catechol 2,3-dioxygenase-like lactoylglutathione lyase family enzyme
MFDHLGVVVGDLAKSRAFYTQALAPIGHSRVAELMVDSGSKPSIGFCHEDGSDLWISQGESTRPLHMALRVSSRAAVDAFYAAALAAGGHDNGEPG